MSKETNLNHLIRNMQPLLEDASYVFVSIPQGRPLPIEEAILLFKEDEGTTAILHQKDADVLGISYDLIFSKITLQVHSSLEAIGFTAYFSNLLAKHQMSCNVVAGYYHDHLFVPQKQAKKALALLMKSSQDAANQSSK